MAGNSAPVTRTLRVVDPPWTGTFGMMVATHSGGGGDQAFGAAMCTCDSSN